MLVEERKRSKKMIFLFAMRCKSPNLIPLINVNLTPTYVGLWVDRLVGRGNLQTIKILSPSLGCLRHVFHFSYVLRRKEGMAGRVLTALRRRELSKSRSRHCAPRTNRIRDDALRDY